VAGKANHVAGFSWLFVLFRGRERFFRGFFVFFRGRFWRFECEISRFFVAESAFFVAFSRFFRVCFWHFDCKRCLAVKRLYAEKPESFMILGTCLGTWTPNL
jgi:hypothetical protein